MTDEVILSNPALLYLYCRVEQLFGIKATVEAVVRLNEYMQKCCGVSFIEDPAAYEAMFDLSEHNFEIAKYVTINETYFFREHIHFNLLVQLLVQYKNLNRPIQICSAATSIGCEAYTIAMLLDHYRKNHHHIEYDIDAFDISAEAVCTAKTGRYTKNTLRSDSADWKYIMDNYLIQEGDEYVICREIRSKINFFTHNIMNGTKKKYDIIFFRNTLIYFSQVNRLHVINDLVDSLADDGILFTGVSETSSVKHPLLVCKNSSDVFYFQKTPDINNSCRMNNVPKIINNTGFPISQTATKPVVGKIIPGKPIPEKSPLEKRAEIEINCEETKKILEIDEGRTNAKKILDIISSSVADETTNLSGSQLTASVIYYLNNQDFSSAALILLCLERCSNEAPSLFLRGEYHYLLENTEEAEHFYRRSARKDKAFWPAFYRLVLLDNKENPVRYEYKIKNANESLQLGKNYHYECFLGGFSPDYFNRILERKLIPEEICR